MAIRIQHTRVTTQRGLSLPPLLSRFATLHPHWRFLCSLTTRGCSLLLSTGAPPAGILLPQSSARAASSSSELLLVPELMSPSVCASVLLFSSEQHWLSGLPLLFIVSPLSTLHCTHSPPGYKLPEVRDFISTPGMRACDRCKHRHAQRSEGRETPGLWEDSGAAL